MASLTRWASLHKLQEVVKDREACHAAVHGVTESDATEGVTSTITVIILAFLNL